MSIDDFGRYIKVLHNGHYVGPLTRKALLAALDGQAATTPRHTGNRRQRRADRLGRNPFHLALFTWEFVQHEAIHHGQWSIYASLAGFDTPVNWRASWGL